MFTNRNVGKTLVTRTTGIKARRSAGMAAPRCAAPRRRSSRFRAAPRGTPRARRARRVARACGAASRRCATFGSDLGCAVSPQIASEGLKGRVIEASLADLNQARPGRRCGVRRRASPARFRRCSAPETLNPGGEA